MPLERIGAPGPEPALLEVDGLLELRWPGSPAATVEVATRLLEALVAEVNVGRRSLAVLGEVATALTKLGTS